MVLKVALKIILGFKNCRRSNSRHLTSSDTAYRILGVPFACLLNTKSCQDGYRRKLPNCPCVARRFDVACMSVCLSVCLSHACATVNCLLPEVSVARVPHGRCLISNWRTRLASKLAPALRILPALCTCYATLSAPAADFKLQTDLLHGNVTSFVTTVHLSRPTYYVSTFPTPLSDIYLRL